MTDGPVRAGAAAGSTPGGTLGLCPVIRMRPADHPPSQLHRPDERPPPGAVTVACIVGFVAVVLLAISPLFVVSGAFTAGVCAVAAREYR